MLEKSTLISGISNAKTKIAITSLQPYFKLGVAILVELIHLAVAGYSQGIMEGASGGEKGGWEFNF